MRSKLKTISRSVTIFLTARYVSAVYAVVACPSVRLSQAGVVSKLLDESSWLLALRLLSIHLTLCYKEMWVSPKIRVLPSGTLSRTQDFKNFAAASRSRCQQLVVVDDGRVCRRQQYDNRRVVAVYYKSINCNPLTPLLRFIVVLLYNLFLQLTRFWLT